MLAADDSPTDPFMGRVVIHSTDQLVNLIGPDSASHAVSETAPVRRPKCKDWAIRILAVPDEHPPSTRFGGYLDALAAVAPAITGGPPAVVGHVVHRCSATLLIKSREALRGRASDRSRSNACAALLTSAGLSIVMPSTAVSA